MDYKGKVFSIINNIEKVDENVREEQHTGWNEYLFQRDIQAEQEAKEKVNSLAKPLGSLGKLEELAVKLAGITGKVNNKVDKKCIIILSSDNGVVEEGVASSPQYITLAQTINFSKGITGVAVLAKENNTDLFVVDIGVNCDVEIPGAIPFFASVAIGDSWFGMSKAGYVSLFLTCGIIIAVVFFMFCFIKVFVNISRKATAIYELLRDKVK